MTNLNIVKINKGPLLYFSEERISGSILPESEFSSASVGIVAPNVTQKPHYHKRRNNGVEIIFIYEGKFKLVTASEESETFDVMEDGPIFVQVPSNVVASIKNVGEKEVKFFSVFAPVFELGEIVYTE